MVSEQQVDFLYTFAIQEGNIVEIIKSLQEKHGYCFSTDFIDTVTRACSHKRIRTSFWQILMHTALKILARRQPACGFLPCLH